MVPRKILDALDPGLRRLAAQVNWSADLPFGCKHILLFGDLAQVPAVVYTRDDYSESSNQFFVATCYSQFTRFSLSQVMRQNPNETDFLALLADVRDARSVEPIGKPNNNNTRLPLTKHSTVVAVSLHSGHGGGRHQFH